MQLLYRRRAKDGDMTLGEPPLSGIDAMREVIKTRIGELLGAWQADAGETFMTYLSRPVNDENRRALELLVVEKILTTPHVKGVSDVQTTYLKDRSFAFSCRVRTAYGEITAEAIA